MNLVAIVSSMSSLAAVESGKPLNYFRVVIPDDVSKEEFCKNMELSKYAVLHVGTPEESVTQERALISMVMVHFL